MHEERDADGFCCFLSAGAGACRGSAVGGEAAVAAFDDPDRQGDQFLELLRQRVDRYRRWLALSQSRTEVDGTAAGEEEQAERPSATRGVGSESGAQMSGIGPGRWPIWDGHRCEDADCRSSMSGGTR